VYRKAAAVLLVLFTVAARAQTPVVDPAYTLHAGDKVQVAVWKEPDLLQTLTINPDGKLTMPLAGEFIAAGKTVTQLRSEIETRLKALITEPVVTVSIVEFNGNVAYVIGQVNKPGALIMNPRINVLQALSLTGGGTPFAKLDDIIVVRGAASGQRVLPFRYSQVSGGKHLEQNVVLEAGDVVIVP
jgi:polysaccharide export outer membrane protein